MSKGVRLSEKHGVNPCLGMCAWCGGDTGEVVLMGRLPGDREAPMRAVVSYDPCSDCREKWDQGIVLLEVVREPMVDGQSPLFAGGTEYPTGRLVVVTEQWVRRSLTEPMATKVLSSKKALLDVETFTALLGENGEQGNA